MKKLKRKVKQLTRLRPAADTPWTSSMNYKYEDDDGARDGPSSAPQPTVAAFSPNQSSAAEQRRTRGASVIVHQKTPLLVATPPQVTRALAYSHPFILPLNYLVGLLSWTTGDPWESFLLVACFWFVCLYGDAVMRWAGPLVLVVVMILGMYNRRYSPLSSTTWSGEKDKKGTKGKGEAAKKQSKSLDEILDCLQLFTSRCNILLEPFLQLVEFLSTQTTATSATTRPALTMLFLRILMFTPIWIALTLPPLCLITTQRVTLATGTFVMSYHSRPARVSRTILWRSRTIRNAISVLTGLTFPSPVEAAPPTIASFSASVAKAAAARDLKARGGRGKPDIRFTFTVYENQRRWLGLGWTASLLAYERQAWTDEHLNTCPDPDTFTLPDTENATAKWRWAPGLEWRIEGALTEKEKSAKRIGGGGGGDDSGWTYYDNKWRDGRREDGWSRYTRRRKWIREAELVDASEPDAISTASRSERPAPMHADSESTIVGSPDQDTADASSIDSSEARKQGWFKRRGQKGSASERMSIDGASASGTNVSGDSRKSRDDDPEDDHHTPVHYRQREWEREIGEGLVEGLG